MNNKGITLVELIISFALLMVVVIGMLNIIMSVRTNYNEKSFATNMLEFKTTMTETIEKDLIKKELNASNPISDCPNVDTGIYECKVLNFKDGDTYELRIGLQENIVYYGKVSQTIKYEIPNKDFIEFLDSRTNSNDIANVEIKVENGFLKINVPYFEIDKDVNYGFKIIHPISL